MSLQSDYGITVGTTDITPQDASTVSGTSGKDRLQSGAENGAANTGYQRFFGGDGNDTFILRAKDFAPSSANDATKYIADFYGAAGEGKANWSANANDFIAFNGFGEGSKLELFHSRDGTVPDSTLDKIYTYHILNSANEILGTFDLQSINGKVLGAGDYAFYG